MSLVFPPYPLPVITPLGSGYIVYVKDNGMFENDEVCVSLLDGGQWRHFATEDIKTWHNATYGIIKTKPNESAINPRSTSEFVASNGSSNDSEK